MIFKEKVGISTSQHGDPSGEVVVYFYLIKISSFVERRSSFQQSRAVTGLDSGYLRWRSSWCRCGGRPWRGWPSSWPAGRKWRAGGSPGRQTPWPGWVPGGRCSSWQPPGCKQSGAAAGAGAGAGPGSSSPGRCRAWSRSPAHSVNLLSLSPLEMEQKLSGWEVGLEILF